jgi:tetratricopeptide (TPR) repeat protein
MIPRQLLPPPRRFANRRLELAALNNLLEESFGSAPTVLVLRGPGGVGKTALALRWLVDVVDLFPDGQLQADLALSTGEAVASEDVLGQFLRALGVSPRRVPLGLAERTVLYRSITADRALAVLLDNAVSAAQVRVLLPTSARSLAVVTSRHPLLGLLAEGAQVLPVDPLDPAGGLELLTRAIGAQRVAPEQAQAKQLVELCDGLPVALCVVAARVAARPRRPLARMVAELRDERTRLDTLSAEGELSVRSTFDVAYAGLLAPLQQVYRTLGLHPGAVLPVEAAAAATGTEVPAVRRHLEQLVDASLLEEWGENHYRFHDLVRVHALDQALTYDSDDARTASLGRTLQWYLLAAQTASRTVMPARRVLTYDFDEGGAGLTVPTAAIQPAAALDWLEQHRLNLVDATRDAAKCDWAALTYHLADALQPLFILHQHDRDAMEVDEVALRAAETMGDTAAEYSMRKRLARLYAHVGYLDRAEQQATELLRRTRARHDRRGEASALKSLGQMFARQGRLDEAATVLGEALDLLRPLGKRRGEALLLIDLGITLDDLGRLEEATGHLRHAAELFDSLSPPDPYNQARAHAALGHAYVAAGTYGPAQGLLQDAITVLATYGADHERARVHRTMAELGRRTSDETLTVRHDRIADSLLTALEQPAAEDLGR